MTRATRNKNPLNLRRSSSDWQGLVSPYSDYSFCEFTTMAYGWRAAFLNLRTIYQRGYHTIRQIISIWAPETDGNNTTLYIKRVCEDTHLREDEFLERPDKNPGLWLSIGYSMSCVESSPVDARQYMLDSIAQGYAMAFPHQV